MFSRKADSTFKVDEPFIPTVPPPPSPAPIIPNTPSQTISSASTAPFNN